MIRAYDKDYLNDTMNALGSMLDYAVNTCGEDPAMFYEQFLRSGIASQIEKGNPRYLSGVSGVEMALIVANRTGGSLKNGSPVTDMGSREFWAGWTLAYLQWYFCKSFKTMQAAGIGIMEVIEKYPTLHEADLSKSVSFAQKVMEAYALKNNQLRQRRKNANLTQKELSSLSGTSLRAIRAYEQSQIPLSSANAGSVLKLSLVLGCTPGDLI